MKKATRSEEQGSQSRLHDTCGHAQRVRMLAGVQAGSVTTIAARSELNIMMPAARVKELRELGHPIKTHRITMTDDHGRIHRGVALYYLGTLPARVEE